MDQIKRIEDVILSEGDVFVRIEELKNKSDIVLPDSKLSDNRPSQYGTIIAVGTAVKDLVVGDIILSTRTGGMEYTYGGKKYALFTRGSVAIAVKKENFDATDELTV